MSDWAPEDLKTNPRDYVVEVVLSLLVGGFLSMGESVYRRLLSVFDQIARLPDILIGDTIAAFAPLGRGIFGLVEWYGSVLRDVALLAGPLAPVVITGGYVLLALGVYGLVSILIQILDPR